MHNYSLNDEEAQLIAQRINALREPAVFILKELFTEAEWLALGDGDHRRHLGTRFGRDAQKERFPRVKWIGIRKNGRDAEYSIAPPE